MNLKRLSHQKDKKIDMKQFKERAVKYLGLYEFDDWKFKIYSLKYDETRITDGIEEIIKLEIPNWVKKKTQINSFSNYKIGTVIIHEAVDSILTIINWWVYENVLQNHVYYSEYKTPNKLEDFSNKGVQFCVWEMNIIWHERNLWVEHILKNSKKPDWKSYLSSHYESNYAN